MSLKLIWEIKLKSRIKLNHNVYFLKLHCMDIINDLKLQSLTDLEQRETRPEGKRCNIKLASQWLVHNKRQFNVLKATFKLVTTSSQHFLADVVTCLTLIPHNNVN